MNTSPRQQYLGILLIGLGILFLLGQAFNINLSNLIRIQWWDIYWPYYVIVPGVLLAAFGLAAKTSPLSVLGVVAAVTGCILLYQDTTDNYQTWAYVWALVAPASIGAGLTLHGLTHHEQEMVRTGSRMLTIGLILFAVGFIFFELLVGLSGFGIANPGLMRFAGPVLLIALGVFIYLRRQS